MRDCCVLVLTETWLGPSVLDDAVSMAGLTTFRADRDSSLTGKTRSGGVCIYTNNSWWSNAVKTVQCRPFYLPREFTTIIIMAVYIPPSANTKEALSILYRSISKLQSTHSEDVFIVAGDFNQANMKTVLPHFHQYVDFATRGKNTLDRVYCNIKQAFRAVPRPHLGFSDHLSVMLTPAYKPLLIRKKPTVKQVRVWPEGAMEALQDCFECTDWDMFRAAATDIDCTRVEEYAESVSGYILKCVEDVSRMKNISTRANEKPWMNHEVRAALKARNVVFKSGDTAALSTARANLNRAIRIAKRTHGQKVQDFFQDPGNTRRMWQGIQAITDYKAAPLLCDSDTGFLNNLNNYFGRFDTANTTPARKMTPHLDEQPLSLATADVRRTLKGVNTRKAAGPDNIPGRMLKE